ncbi:MAG: hypothetical protein Q9165_000913 [Trypethelium subeluteriae]
MGLSSFINGHYARLRDPEADSKDFPWGTWDTLRVLIPATWQNGRSRKVLLGVIAFIGALVLAVGAASEHIIVPQPRTEAPTSAYLHLLRPTATGNVDSCRAMLSALVLGYPVPTMHVWGQAFNNRDLVEGGIHMSTLFGVLHYLQELGSDRDRDLVIIASGSDAWFQLPPDVLIQRYHQINKGANERIKRSMGKAADVEGIKQTILFTADESCKPNSEEEPACYAVPDSPLSPQLYAPYTDRKNSNPDIQVPRQPPRYLKYSGVIIGPVKEMRALYRRAGKKSNAVGDKTDLQRIFNEIYGEQEYQRKVMAARHSRMESLTKWLRPEREKEKGLATETTYHTMDDYRGKPLEFGIGLDYLGLISHPSASGESDFAWVHYNSADELKNASQRIHVKPPRITALPEDLVLARPPYFAFNAFEIDLPNSTWSDLPLLTNVRTGVVPAILYDNAKINGRTARRYEWWRQMWYQPDLKSLIKANILPSKRPIAVDTDHPDGDVVWFDKERERRGARTETGGWIPWEEVCRGSYSRVFETDE